MFSIIIPYYKKRKYIERCLDSVIAQTHQGFEIILVDDGSQDDIAELIDHKYPQVKLIQQQNQGVSAARNTGIKNAKNDFVAFLDADDCWNPYYLEYVSNVIFKDIECKIVGTHYSRDKYYIQKNPDLLSFKKIDNYFSELAIKNTLFSSSSTVIKKSFFDTNSGFNTFLKSGEDLDVWFRVMSSIGNAYYINNTLVYYSDEDEDQLTKKVIDLDYTLIGNINPLFKEIIKRKENKDFKIFIDKYVYFNLFPYYFNKSYHVKSKNVLKSTSYYSLFLHLPYYLPLFVGKSIVESPLCRKVLRNYFKFILKYF